MKGRRVNSERGGGLGDGGGVAGDSTFLPFRFVISERVSNIERQEQRHLVSNTR